MAKKDEYSSRNTNMNYTYMDDNGAITTINNATQIITNTNYSASKLIKNITLTDSLNPIKVLGSTIIEDAKANPNIDPFGLPDIDTTSITDNETYNIYGSPEKYVLKNHQSYNNCGVMSSLNVLVMAGKMTITDQTKTEKEFTKKIWDLGLCQDAGIYGVLDKADGGTTLNYYEKILKLYDIQSTFKGYGGDEEHYTKVDDKYKPVTLEELATAVQSGKGIIMGVASDILWGEINTDICSTTKTIKLDTKTLVTNTLTAADITDPENPKCAYYSYTPAEDSLVPADAKFYRVEDEIIENITVYGVGHDNEELIKQLRETYHIKDDEPITKSYFAYDNGDDTYSFICGNDYKEYNNTSLDHAICLTGVVKNESNTKTIGFYIQDTGAWATRYISEDDLANITLAYKYITVYDGEASSLKKHNVFCSVTDDNIKEYTDPTTATGNNLDNIITANSLDNLIKAQKGNDTVYGGNGADTIYGGAGNDLLYGCDTVTDSGNFEDGNNKIYGDAGADLIHGALGNDYLNGGADNDTLFGWGGADTIYGGAGNDLIYGYDSIVGKYADESNTIFGEAGNDTIHGGNNNDTIDGGAGNDTVYGYHGNDFIKGGAGNDFLCGDKDDSSEYKGSDTIYGGNGNDTIYGNLGNDLLYGDNGNDEIYGGAGEDIIYGGTGNDTIHGMEDNDIIYGGAGNDSLIGDAGDDRIFGQSGKNDISGAAGEDTLIGGTGNDTIDGGLDDDCISGGKGNDSINGGAGKDFISGDAGNDTINGDDDDDLIFGDTYKIVGDDNYLSSGSGNDIIYGGKGNDTIHTCGGNDIIYAEENDGNDTIYFGSGTNTYIIDYHTYGKDTLEGAASKYTTTIQYKEISAYELNYSMSCYSDVVDVIDIVLKEDSENSLTFKEFLNTSKIKTYIVDETKTKYLLSANENSDSISISNTKSNNIFVTADEKSNNVTTTKYSDVVYLSDGNDTISYTGGKDYYISTSGNDTYYCDIFNKNTFLTIIDNAGNDTLNINGDKSIARLFFDLDKNGNYTTNTNLYLTNNTVINDGKTLLKNLSGDIGGSIDISNYFSTGTIETVKYNDTALDINSMITSIKSNVAGWLADTEHSYDTVQKVLDTQDTDLISNLMTCYNVSA